MSDAGDQSALLAEGHLDAIILGIVKAILRRGGAAAARSTSSRLYRGMLYTSLVHLMQHGEGQYLGAGGVEGLQSASGGEWLAEHATEYSDAFTRRCMV